MRKVVLSLALTVFGCACMANVCLTLAGRPWVDVPPQYASVVAAMACLYAFHLASEAVLILGRVGVILTALPVFGVVAVAGYGLGGPLGAVAGFAVPLLVTVRWGLVGLAGMALAGVGAAFLAAR